jgi:hypothetical protein
MKFCLNVGFTHWEDGGMGPDFIQQRSEMFFAPSHIQKRLKNGGLKYSSKKQRLLCNPLSAEVPVG